MAQGGGWLGRARRLVEGDDDCVEQGYLLVPEALQSFGAGDFETGYATFARVGDIGRRFDDVDLVALGCLGRGQALILKGDARGAVSRCSTRRWRRSWLVRCPRRSPASSTARCSRPATR